MIYDREWALSSLCTYWRVDPAGDVGTTLRRNLMVTFLYAFRAAKELTHPSLAFG
jgi:hypothetical protein